MFLGPVWAYLSAFTAIILGALIYFLRLQNADFLATAAGGVVTGVAFGCK